MHSPVLSGHQDCEAQLRMGASRSGHSAEECCSGVVQDGSGRDALPRPPADSALSSWGNERGVNGNGGGRDKESDAAGFLFPGFRLNSENNAGQARVTNNQLKFCQRFPQDDIVPYVSFTSDVRENPPSSCLQLIRSINTSKNIVDDGSFESVLQASSRSSQEVLSNIAFPVPNNGLCLNFVTSDMLNMMDENKEGWMSNSSSCSKAIPSLENYDLEMLQISNHQMFNLASEEFSCRELQVILCKELTNSDVANIGRIVLPKREAEAYLPPLSEREGIWLHMDDMTLAVTWKFKFRFWPNNKSRMYILENTGGFVRAHCLQAGDFLIICRNPTSGNHIVRGNKGMPQWSPLDSLQYCCRNQIIINEECSSSTLHAKKGRSDRRHSPIINPNKIIGHGSSSLTMTDMLNDLEGDTACHPRYFPE
ncbi:B3 DNA binding domain [Musa troglodytarum]|uniref:B3 DNA binding domain n=1 Tax=Musa troglodytarum TaxID=320322 RepID=A0A9E7FAX0_9LILI|nr:B3 DNA binding domain [Musa troglodytarum]